MIVALVGVSCAGKSYLKSRLLDVNKMYISLVAITTRDKRKYEIDGKDKFFLTKEEFKEYEDQIDIISEIYGERYGFWKKDLCRCENQIVELYYKDICKIKDYNVKTILVVPGCWVKKEYLLIKRYGISWKLFNRILVDIWVAFILVLRKHEFDYILINDYSEDCVEKLRYIVEKIEKDKLN